MNVSELRDALAEIPDDAMIRIEHELAGDQVDLVMVEYNKKYNIVLLHETDD